VASPRQIVIVLVLDQSVGVASILRTVVQIDFVPRIRILSRRPGPHRYAKRCGRGLQDSARGFNPGYGEKGHPPWRWR